MLDWLQKLEASPRTLTEMFKQWYRPAFKPDPVAKMLYNSLSSRYSPRQWIVIVHLRNP